MKITAAFLLCSLSLYSALAEAQIGSCRPLEYAEIKDTPTKDLIKTYCYYERLGANVHDFSMKHPLNPAADGWRADFAECNAQQAKIATALKARSKKIDLTCKTPFAAKP